MTMYDLEFTYHIINTTLVKVRTKNLIAELVSGSAGKGTGATPEFGHWDSHSGRKKN